MDALYTNLSNRKTPAALGNYEVWIMPVGVLNRTIIEADGSYLFQSPEAYTFKGVSYLLELSAGSYKLSETPKSVKGSTFYDVKLTGATNVFGIIRRQVLESFRSTPVQFVTVSREAEQRAFGIGSRGLDFAYEVLEDNEAAGVLRINISITGESTEPAPFIKL